MSLQISSHYTHHKYHLYSDSIFLLVKDVATKVEKEGVCNMKLLLIGVNSFKGRNLYAKLNSILLWQS